MQFEDKIQKSLLKFKPNLKGKNVLTEAATGNYLVTPILAALSGANVFAITKNSKHGSISDVKEQTYAVAQKLNVHDKIKIIQSYNEIDLSMIDVLTNTGFNRPINKLLIENLDSKCVIPLMWEPWEYRKEDLDIEACYEKGIKVYGTNESDARLQTMKYIAYIVLYFLLQSKKSPFSSKILILGDVHFSKPVEEVLNKNGYNVDWQSDYADIEDVEGYDTIVLTEHTNDHLIIGEKGILKSLDNQLIIHIAGNVDITSVNYNIIPEKPASFGRMSFTTDYIDNMAVIDLHTAGLKVAEGMLEANRKCLGRKEYKLFMENNYPALSFENEMFW